MAGHTPVRAGEDSPSSVCLRSSITMSSSIASTAKGRPIMTNVPAEISNFFLAMQAGAKGGDAMEKVLAEDAVYEEPFSGKAVTHRGREAILTAMRAGWERPLPKMHIEIDRAET